MADTTAMRIAVLASMYAALAGCGKTGDLYLPDPGGEVVTRPAATPPDTDATAAPDSPRTPDSLPAPPAPDVSDEESKKEKGASPPPQP